ncbi:hypothetical protein [Deinococcus roseus]|uniref:RNA polymerase sigma-70 region 2 domain-containing protein n=1 Tax=Deinococcus roseus TaxID=392414 RepID=A0ABQ2D686_9DEIO|nr:hypothetical protein [Deinococcus roseus]GGJ44744.1 hypothetical protein GCM10008938_33680 [Deinococcus roseus]
MKDLKALFETHAGQVLAFLLHLQEDREQADELLIETFVQVQAQWESFEGGNERRCVLRVAHGVYLKSRMRTFSPEAEGPAPEAGVPAILEFRLL